MHKLTLKTLVERIPCFNQQVYKYGLLLTITTPSTTTTLLVMLLLDLELLLWIKNFDYDTLQHIYTVSCKKRQSHTQKKTETRAVLLTWSAMKYNTEPFK